MAVQHEYDITTTSSEAGVQRYSVRKVFLEISQNSTGKHLCQRACNFIKKETLAQVFSYEFCDVSKNSFFYRTPLVAAYMSCRFKFESRSKIFLWINFQ